LWWGYEPYVPFDYPFEYAGEEPLYAFPPGEDFSHRSRPVVFHEPGCRTDTQTVPSQAGGERTIHIVRCY
jgi:hypothetical protein